MENWNHSRTTRSASINNDLSLVNSCASLHFPRGAAFLGALLASLDMA